MRSDIKQILFFAGFGFICCIFVFFVPWGNSDQQKEETITEIGTELSGEQTSSQTPILPLLSWALKVQLPNNIALSGVREIFSWFEEKYGVKIQILPSLKSKSKPDLIITEKSDLTWLSLNLSSPIENYFLTGLQEIVKNQNLIPLGVDPLMVYTHKKSDLTWSFQTREETRNPKSASSAFFPLRSEKSNLWSDTSLNTHAIELLISELEATNNIAKFQELIDRMIDEDLSEKLVSALLHQEKCKEQVISCMIERGFLAVGFSFRSQIAHNPDLISDFFPSKLEKHYFKPYFFAIPAQSPNPDWARMLLLYYLQLEDEKLTTLSQNLGLISPFVHLNTSENGVENFMLWDEKAYHPNSKKAKLLKKIIEKKLKPDLYFDQAFVY